MAKYRSKPIEIEAVQWTGDNYEEVATFTGNDKVKSVNKCLFLYGLPVNQGDYIVEVDFKGIGTCGFTTFAKELFESDYVLAE